MRLTEFLQPEFCIMDLKADNKEEAIKKLTSILSSSGKINDKDDFLKHIFERECLGPTGIGNRVAIPHAKTQSVEGVVVAFGRCLNGLDFQSLDGELVNLIFLIGSNPGDVGMYLKFLAALSKLLSIRQFREELISADSSAAVMEVFKKYEKS